MAAAGEGGAAAGAAAVPVVEAVNVSRKVTLYKRIATEAQRVAANEEANALIGSIVSVSDVQEGARCNFQLENMEDRVSLSVTGDDVFVRAAMRLGRAIGWKQSLSVAEEIRVRTIPRRSEMAALLAAEGNWVQPARPANVLRLHDLRLVAPQAEGFPSTGLLSQIVTANPHMRPANVARAVAERRQIARYDKALLQARQRGLRDPAPRPLRLINAQISGQQHAQDPNVRRTRRNVWGRSSSSSSE